MKSFVKPILSLSLVAAFLAFGLTACSKDASPTPNPSSTNTATPSSQQQTMAPTVTPSATSTPTAVFEKKELKEAQEAYPDVEAKEGATKEEIQLALFGANRYINTIYNSGYLANGSWVKNGADSQDLFKLYGQDWSDSYRSKLENLITEYHSADKEVKDKAAADLMIHFFFFDGTGLTLPEDCSHNNVGVGSCLVNGQLESDTETTYQVNSVTGHIFVDAKFKANIRLIKDGIAGVTPITYNVQLEMIKNPYPDEENLRYAYIVNDLGGDWKIDKWYEGDK
jgi:hypothetical protein